MLQTQGLSPLQVMIARLLSLTTIEMEERVRGEVIDNPALEVSTHGEVTEGNANEDSDKATITLAQATNSSQATTVAKTISPTTS